MSASTVDCVNGRYDLHISDGGNMPRRSSTPDEIQARLDAGKPLGVGDVAALLGVSRFGVNNWIVNGVADPESGGRWYPTVVATPGGHRKIVAESVLRLVELAQLRAARSRRHSAPPASTDPGSDS